MKNAKTIALTLLSLSALQFAPVMAASDPTLPVYQQVVSDVYLRYDRAFLNGVIKLTSGEIFRIIDYKTRDDAVMTKWQKGDVVVFKPDSHKGQLILTVDRVAQGCIDNAAEPYVIYDAINSPTETLSIIEVREKGKYVKLSDNSVWEFSFYNQYSTEDWKVGERVLLAGNGDKNSYHFINLDAPVADKVYKATGSFVTELP